MISGQASERAFFGALALLFTVAAAVTALWCNAMSGAMPMPGGWAMSMAWMRMPDQTWAQAAAAFLAMWLVMMAAMMLPSLISMFARYLRAMPDAARPVRLMIVVSLGYFAVWTLLGVAVFPLGVALAAIEMQMPTLARAVPVAAGVVIVIAGLLQFSAWKSRELDCCRQGPRHTLSSGFLSSGFRPANISALRYGFRLGLHCCACCAGLTAVLLVIGVMDLSAMAAVTVAITAERTAPGGAHLARAIGFVVIAAGLFLIARACFG